MGNEEKQRQYEEYIKYYANPLAAAIGRRVPYHLEYLRKRGDMAAPETYKEKAEPRGESARTNNWGIYASAFWKFYGSGSRTGQLEYADAGEALRANRAMLNRMNRKHIYDVRITRRGNVLYLEKTGVGNVGGDNSGD